jgi:hypothetical protein
MVALMNGSSSTSRTFAKLIFPVFTSIEKLRVSGLGKTLYFIREILLDEGDYLGLYLALFHGLFS